MSNFTHKDYICNCFNRDKRYISCRVWIIVQRIFVYIVTNGTAHVMSQSLCEDYGFVCQIIKKVKQPIAKLDSMTKESWIAIAILQASLPTTTFLLQRASFIRLLRLRLLIYKIAVGKREAVAFKYRLKSILSCWCQPAPLAIPLQKNICSLIPVFAFCMHGRAGGRPSHTQLSWTLSWPTVRQQRGLNNISRFFVSYYRWPLSPIHQPCWGQC